MWFLFHKLAWACFSLTSLLDKNHIYGSILTNGVFLISGLSGDFAFSSKSDNFEILPYAVPSKKFKRPSLSQFSTYLKTEGEFEISIKKYNSGEPRFDLGKNLFQFDHSIEVRYITRARILCPLITLSMIK